MTLAGRTGTPMVVVKAVGSHRALPIYLGPFEAGAIWQRLSGEAAPRPMTHDLLKNVMDAAGMTLDRAVITGERNGTYVAELRLRRGLQAFTVDARPSDAIALALRCGGNVYVSRALMRSGASFDLTERKSPVRAGGLTLQDVTPELARSLGREAGRGALVADVRPSRWAGHLERGDVVLAVNGREVSGVAEALLRLNEAGGARVTLVLLRRGARLSVAVPVERP